MITRFLLDGQVIIAILAKIEVRLVAVLYVGSEITAISATNLVMVGSATASAYVVLAHPKKRRAGPGGMSRA